jgi:mitochondrial fission protein ELM1
MLTRPSELVVLPPQRLNLPKPVVWVLQGPRAGDNAQAHGLASRLEAQVVCKHLTFNDLHILPSLFFGASARTLETGSRSGLVPPWPDMVIAIGRRSAPVARWIKRESLGKTKAVQLGRPRTPFSAFDLVITTPQYGLPPAANVIEIPLPFITTRSVAAPELAAWRTEWAGLRRPRIAVAIGHAKFPLRMGPREARLLGQRINSLAERIQGSLLLMPSPRSVSRLIDRIEAEISAPHLAYRTFDPRKNPYPAALKDCDYFVATSDSISMISELISTGKPVDVFELPERGLKLKWRARAGLGAWLAQNGVLQAPRDVSGMVRALIQNGYVNVLGERKDRILFERDDTLIFERLNSMLGNTCMSDRRQDG